MAEAYSEAVQQALDAAVAGDVEPFVALLLPISRAGRRALASVVA
jgi:hypothetical protein